MVYSCFFFVTAICVQFLSYTAFSAVGIRARLSVFAFSLSFLMSSDAKEHIRDKLRCRPAGAVVSARPRESAAFSPLSPVFVGLKCAQASRVFVFLSVVFIVVFCCCFFA